MISADGKLYRNEHVRIADLAVTQDAIEDVTFENCVLVGPAVVISLGSHLNYCRFEGDIDAILWEIPESREMVLGAIGLVRCTLNRCVTQRIGWAGKPEQMLQFRLETTTDDPEVPND